jgi:hypothetical protein
MPRHWTLKISPLAEYGFFQCLGEVRRAPLSAVFGWRFPALQPSRQDPALGSAGLRRSFLHAPKSFHETILLPQLSFVTIGELGCLGAGVVIVLAKEIESRRDAATLIKDVSAVMLHEK